MEKLTEIKLHGRSYWLHFSISCMFDMQEKYGSLPEAMALITQSSQEGFEATKWFVLKLAEAGELCRRAEGQDSGHMITEDDITPQMLTPYELVLLQEAVVNAIGIGYNSEVAPDKQDEVDLGLQELQKKKEISG